MSKYLGIDTSNYTTSFAVYDSDNQSFINKKKLLPVNHGEKGLRQSDAVFHHTVQMPEVLAQIDFDKAGPISAVGVSYAPTTQEGSYMPCFLCGVAEAEAVSRTNRILLYRFSHQQGHIAAVLASAGKNELINEPFYAFHLSGGTTDLLFVKPDREKIFDISLIAHSLDLKAGQAVDRTGVMLGLDFPCGAQLDKLSFESEKVYKIKPSLKGVNCSLSGIENKCRKMLDDGEKPSDIAKFCILSIISNIDAMLIENIKLNGALPLIFCGGVSSNSLIQSYFKEKYNAVFSSSEFSCDNAAGIAYLAYLKDSLK